MTRKEQLFNAATENYGLDVRSVNNCVKAFSDGARWADTHPNWHKTKINDNQYDLPDKSGQYLIVHAECPDDIMEGEFLRNSNVWFVENCYYLNYKIIAWMEKPQPPKFG